MSKRIKGLVIVLAIVLVLGCGVFAVQSTFHARIRDPLIEELETLLVEDGQGVRKLRVSVARPTAQFDVYLGYFDSADTGRLLQIVSDYVNEHDVYTASLMPEFEPPSFGRTALR